MPLRIESAASAFGPKQPLATMAAIGQKLRPLPEGDTSRGGNVPGQSTAEAKPTGLVRRRSIHDPVGYELRRAIRIAVQFAGTTGYVLN